MALGVWPDLAPPPQTLQGRPLVAVAEESFREQVLGILGSGRGLEAFLQTLTGKEIEIDIEPTDKVSAQFGPV
ncbi:hypothetical protein TURU_086429 [Turdus rufiventris]|nr:hypothetical protein TURU_086429 [Turdus rufiventris]